MSLPILADSLGSYLAEINRHPILTRDEEYDLSVRWHEKRDIEAAHKLVTANLRFVVKIAFEYANYGISLKDLVQEGNLGLMTAVKKFNPHKGVRLITYASWWIRAFIQEYILKTKGVVKRAGKALKKKLFYKNPLPLGSSMPKLEALPPDWVNLGAKDLSLDAPIFSKDGEKTHIEQLADASASQEEFVAESQERSIVKSAVGKALKVLNQKERFIIEKRVMADEPLSLQAIGHELGLTRERVRQIETAALKKLRMSLKGHALRLALPWCSN